MHTLAIGGCHMSALFLFLRHVREEGDINVILTNYHKHSY